MKPKWSGRNPYLDPRTEPYEIARMEEALMRIGYSRKTGQPRFGIKPQIARWGLGEDEMPEEEKSPPMDCICESYSDACPGCLST